MSQLGVLTIGQSPRQDIQPILEKYLPAGTTLVQKGALDGFSKKQIKDRLSPANINKSTNYLLTSRLTNGDYVSMDRVKLQPLVQQKIDEFENEHIKLILLLCTGVFPELKSRTAHIIEPDRVIPLIVHSLIGNKKLGVIVPLSEQQALNDDKFSKKGLKPIFSFASPYKHEEDEFIYAALSLKGKVDYILMDCMGYNEQMRHMIAQLSCVPTILSNALMAKMISEFI